MTMRKKGVNEMSDVLDAIVTEVIIPVVVYVVLLYITVKIIKLAWTGTW